MKAIQTKYLPCTDHKGSRIKATAEGVRSLTISYPHELDSRGAHEKAAQALADRQAKDTDLRGRAYNGWQLPLAGGSLPNGDMAWVFIEKAYTWTPDGRLALLND